MDLLVNIKNASDRIKDYFKNKDVITMKELIEALEDLLYEKDNLEEIIEDLKSGEVVDPDPFKEWRDNNACR